MTSESLRIICDRKPDQEQRGPTVVASLRYVKPYANAEGWWTLEQESSRSGVRHKHSAIQVLEGDTPSDPRLSNVLVGAHLGSPGDVGQVRERFKFRCTACGNEVTVGSDRVLAANVTRWAAAGMGDLRLDVLRHALRP